MAQLDSYWSAAADLTIYEAAFWMRFEFDPREHAFDCENNSDYAQNFEDRGGAAMAHEQCELINSAIREGSIKLSGMSYKSSHDFDVFKTHIVKTDWIVWCGKNGYSVIAEFFTLENNSSQILVGKVPGVALGTQSATITHRIKTRLNPLSAVIEEARKIALDHTDHHSVWEALKGMAESDMRPRPLTGYSEDEGVLYATEKNPCKVLTKKAFSLRMKRAR